MGEVLWNLMEVLYKRGYVEYHGSLNANVLKEYNLEVPGLRPAWASLKYYCIVYGLYPCSHVMSQEVSMMLILSTHPLMFHITS